MKNTEQKITEDMIRLMQADKSTDAPPDAIRYVKNLFRTMPKPAAESRIRRFLAVLTSDLAPNRAAFGERGSSTASARQMLFQAGDNAVDLRVSETAGAFEIRGQILGESFETGTVKITNADWTAKAELDSSSGFRFSSVPSGEFCLTITSGEGEVVIERLFLS